jgi:eukaryotic-like serine/threonine-protein kinase
MTARRKRRWESRFGARERRIVLRILGIGILGFVFGYGLTALLFFRGTSYPNVVTVPELRNLSGDAAQRTLNRLGLEIQVGDSLPNPEVPQGAVLAQTPLPGREVAPGTSVRVILSLGPQRRPVPEVLALREAQARQILEAAGFEVVAEEVTDPSPAGRVVDVQPAAGSLVALAGRVRLRVSTGPPFVEVPDVVGLDEQDARGALRDAGFAVGEVEYLFSIRGVEGEVLYQEPLPGDSARAGSPVRLRVATQRLQPADPTAAEREPGPGRP